MGMAMKRVAILLFLVFISWVYKAMQPPPPKICGSHSGPPVTAPRIRLRDGRNLAYKEHGVPRETAKYKIISAHGFSNSRHEAVFSTSLSQEFAEELGIYVVGFDRPGYGESDPDPNRTPKSLALDIEELGDQLGLGSKFHVIGFSMGGQAVWSCLQYIPHRLAGAGLITPVVNYWWPGFPKNLSTESYRKQLPADQWTLRVAHYAPWLTYWWNTQKLFPSSSVIAMKPEIFSPPDMEIRMNRVSAFNPEELKYMKQQGEFESLHRDLMVGFGKWEFDPMEMKNPFPSYNGSVHLWQGDDDRFVPVTLQRFIAQKLPWIQYHELPGAGHLFPLVKEVCESMMKELLTGEK